jgi:hypothetical protein
MNNDDSKKDILANILNITSVVKENDLVVYQETPEIDNQAEQDIAYARTMVYDIIKQSADATETMFDIAKQSQHPRAFEVLSTLLNVRREANKDLIDLHKKKKEITGVEQQTGPDTINNNLFVGSTSDLAKALKDLRNGTTD